MFIWLLTYYTLQECISLAAQLSYLYAANRKSLHPFSELLFTSLNGKTHARLESLADAAYKRWSRTEWWTEPLEHLWAPDDADAAEPRKTKAAQESVVYLTADTEDDILELKEGETYVLGGIVDRNRYKVCYRQRSQPSSHPAEPAGALLQQSQTAQRAYSTPAYWKIRGQLANAKSPDGEPGANVAHSLHGLTLTASSVLRHIAALARA